MKVDSVHNDNQISAKTEINLPNWPASFALSSPYFLPPIFPPARGVKLNSLSRQTKGNSVKTRNSADDPSND